MGVAKSRFMTSSAAVGHPSIWDGIGKYIKYSTSLVVLARLHSDPIPTRKLGLTPSEPELPETVGRLNSSFAEPLLPVWGAQHGRNSLLENPGSKYSHACVFGTGHIRISQNVRIDIRRAFTPGLGGLKKAQTCFSGGTKIQGQIIGRWACFDPGLISLSKAKATDRTGRARRTLRACMRIVIHRRSSQGVPRPSQSASDRVPPREASGWRAAKEGLRASLSQRAAQPGPV